MKPAVYKFPLTAHITCSVGWLGAIAAFLALAVAGLASGNDQLVRGAYVAMAPIAWYVIVPLSFAALLTGLVMALGTRWGLFRHYWVVVKFLLTLISIPILLAQMGNIDELAAIAAERALANEEYRHPRMSLVLHSAGGLAVLLAATVLSVYKPWGRPRYGRAR